MAAKDRGAVTADKSGDDLVLELMGKVDDLTAKLAELAAGRAAFEEGIAGKLIQLEQRQAGFDALLARPDAGAADPLARRLLVALYRYFAPQRRQVSPVLLPLLKDFLDQAAPLVPPPRRAAGHGEKEAKVKEIAHA